MSLGTNRKVVTGLTMTKYQYHHKYDMFNSSALALQVARSILYHEFGEANIMAYSLRNDSTRIQHLA